MQAQSKQLDFNGQNFYCGIDIHKKSWAVTIQTDSLILKTFTQDPEPKILYNHLKKNYPGGNYIAGYEAGYFGFGIQRALNSLGVTCYILHPADIPTSQKDKEQKRDPRDSRKIAKALKNNEVEPIWIPPLDIEQDRQLLRAREKLTGDQSRIKNRIKACLQLNGIKYPEIFNVKGTHWSGRFIKWLNEVELYEPSATEALKSKIRHLLFVRSELLHLLQKIKYLSRNERYSRSYNELIKIPGIGMITAMTILTEAGEISRFKRPDNFRAFLGLVPRAHDSGDKEWAGKITKRANSHLRYLIVEATWISIRYNPYYLQHYQEYIKRMKPNIALVRTAGKLSNQIYFCLKNIK